jgi:HK97 family phage major capsid protein
MDEQSKTPLAKGLDEIKESVKGFAGVAATIADEQAKHADAIKSVAEKVEAIAPQVAELKKGLDEVAVKVNTPNIAAAAEKAGSEYGRKFSGSDDFYRAVKFANSRVGKEVESAKFLQTGAETGAYLVPVEFVPQLVDYLPKHPNFVASTFRLPWGVAGNERNIPNLAQRPVAYFTDEAGVKKSSNPAFSLLAQKLKKLYTMIALTDELMADSGINLATILPQIAAASIEEGWSKALFLGDTTSSTNPVVGINTASGVNAPEVADVKGLLALKLAVPAQLRATGKFYIDTALYSEILAIGRDAFPVGYNYMDGKLTIDASEVVPVDASIIGSRNAFFGDLATIIYSPKNELFVKWSNQATIKDVDGTTDLRLFERNMQAFIFESRADITIVGSTWAKANIAAPSAS